MKVYIFGNEDLDFDNTAILVAKKLELDQATAETATAQQRILKKLMTVRAESASVQKLIDMRDAAIAASPAVPTTKAKAKT